MGVTPGFPGVPVSSQAPYKKKGRSEADGQKMLSCWLEGRREGPRTRDAATLEAGRVRSRTPQEPPEDQTCPGLGFTPKGSFVRAATDFTQERG